jgi:hypothetical protein
MCNTPKTYDICLKLISFMCSTPKIWLKHISFMCGTPKTYDVHLKLISFMCSMPK